MKSIHIVFWYNKEVLYFQTSDDRWGTAPATASSYKKVSKDVMEKLGISLDRQDTVEYL